MFKQKNITVVKQKRVCKVCLIKTLKWKTENGASERKGHSAGAIIKVCFIRHM